MRFERYGSRTSRFAGDLLDRELEVLGPEAKRARGFA
jgi:hypothetical protein